MTRFKNGSVLIGAALWLLSLALAIPASAHHSIQAEFDVNKKVTIVGTVVKVEWINPHSYITVDTKGADGKVVRWAFELAGPTAIRRAGMTKEDRNNMKPGDEVTLAGFPAKDGSSTSLLREITLADGRSFKFGTDANGN